MHSLSLTAQTINRTTDVNWLILPIAQRYVRSRFDRMRVKPRGEFRRQLEYKTAWRGGYFVAVAPKNTSRTCPCCGHVSKDNRKTQALFACVACGHSDHADT
ncbi:transposase, partial [Paraburkholderia sp. EB58]